MKTLATVITTYNEKPDRLKRAIDSVLSQGGVNNVLIVSTVDDDKNLEWLSGDSGHLVLANPKSKHPGFSPEGSFWQLNEGVQFLKGQIGIGESIDYFRFFTGNDVLLPGTVKATIDALESHPDKKVCYTDFLRVRAGKTRENPSPKYDRKLHQQTNFIMDFSIFSTELFDLLPFRSEKVGNYAYWDFWLRVYEKYGDVFLHLPINTLEYHEWDDSMHIVRARNPKKREEYMQQRQEFLKLHEL